MVAQLVVAGGLALLVGGGEEQRHDRLGRRALGAGPGELLADQAVERGQPPAEAPPGGNHLRCRPRKNSAEGGIAPTTDRIAAVNASTRAGSTTPNTARRITSSEIDCPSSWARKGRPGARWAAAWWRVAAAMAGP